MIDPNRPYKWAFLAGIVGLSILAVYPPSQTLKSGIDLRGGTSLLYEIDTSGLQGADAADLSSRVMEVLKSRVDPGGLMNIEWRPIGDKRLEVRMPLPSSEAIARRERFIKAKNDLQEKNIARVDVEIALNADAASRPAMTSELVRGVPQREALVADLVRLHDSRAAAAADAPDRAALDSEYEDKMSALLATNVPVQAVVDAAEIKDEAKRSAEVDRLLTANPSYKSVVDNVISAHAAWSKDKADLDDPEDLKRRIKGAGVLDFRILASRDMDSPGEIDNFDNARIPRHPVSRYTDHLAKFGPRPQPGDKLQWFPVGDLLDFTNLKSEADVELAKNTMFTPILEKYGEQWYVLAFDEPGYAMEAPRPGSPDRWKLRRASAESNPMTGGNVVTFQLDPHGGQLFGKLTGPNVGRELGIFLDSVAKSHANINEQITTHCQISGRFTTQETQDMARTLEAGALDAPLKETPLAEQTIGPSLGESNRKNGLFACYLGMSLVALFMVFYYGFWAGGMAIAAVALNILITLAIMAITQSTFTLAGIAGIALTVGMAVDANVLIFERIREERDRGIEFRKSLMMGYDLAFSTILDSHVTTLLTCVVLGLLGTEEIKGFAITLGLGLCASMFTSFFVTKFIYMWLMDKGLLREFRMRRLFTKLNVDWIGPRKTYFTVSSIVVGAGIALFVGFSVAQPDRVYDIEFLGGTSVQVDLRDGLALSDEDVRLAVSTGTDGRPSAAGWLRQAAEDLKNVQMSVGERASQFVVTSDKLTGDEMADLLRASVEPYVESNGLLPEGRTLRIESRPGQLSIEQLAVRRDEAVADAGRAAELVQAARVQSIGDAQDGKWTSFDIATVETNRGLVQASILAAMGDKLRVVQPIAFTARTDEELTKSPYFVVESDDTYLSDVLPDAGPYDIRPFKGGVVLDITLDEKELPITKAELEDRLVQSRLTPEFEDFELRRQQIVPLGDVSARADGSQGYRRFAVLVMDNTLIYDNDPLQWEEELASVEYGLVSGALGSAKSLAKVSNFEPQVAAQIQQEAFFSVLVSLLGIVAYVWLRFGTANWGLAAIMALFHDVAVTLGMLVIFQIRMDLSVLAALLTVIGFSINDTIVIFDRIRENLGKGDDVKIHASLINNSINQTMSRTILTTTTVLLAVLSLFIYGGEGIRGFSFTLLVGLVCGTYSTVAVASSLLYVPKTLHRASLIVGLLFGGGAVFEITPDPTGRIVMWIIVGVVFIYGWTRVSRGETLGRRKLA